MSDTHSKIELGLETEEMPDEAVEKIIEAVNGVVHVKQWTRIKADSYVTFPLRGE